MDGQAARSRAIAMALLQLAIDEGVASATNMAERRAAVSEARAEAKRRHQHRHDD